MVGDIRDRLRAFSRERDWDRFHTPKNLSMALAAEAGELLEIFQWLSDAEAQGADVTRVKEECADIFIYLVRLADVAGFDLVDAAFEKIESNELRYPVDLSRGNSTKYDRRPK